MEKQVEENLKSLIRKQAQNRWKSRVKSFFVFNQANMLKKQTFNNWGIPTEEDANPMDVEQVAKELWGQKVRVEFLSRSKLGLLSYKIFSNGNVYKCLDCSKEELAEKIEAIILCLRENKIDCIPFEKRKGRFLFLKWVKGRQISLKDFLIPGFLENLAKLQADLHNCPLSEWLKQKYTPQNPEYLGFLVKRLCHFSKKYLPSKDLTCQTISKVLSEHPLILGISITHPDFTDNNLVVSGGKVWLIDIETLNIDFGYEYDILNTTRFLFPNQKFFQSHYLFLYKKYNSLGTLETERNFWEKIWLIRLAGSRFQAGDAEQGKSFLEILKSNMRS